MILISSGAPRVFSAQARSSRDAYALIEAVNELRASHGLPAYAINPILMGTAQAQADYMASIGSATHTGPGGSSVTQRLLAAGYPLAGNLSLGGFRSENVVASAGMTPAGAVNAWTGDEIHLHTMLSADLQEIGAGVAEKDGVYYYVIDCARPTSGGLPQAYTPGVEGQYSAGENDIIIPVVVSTPDEKGKVIHEVQAGQSVWLIAIAYGVKIDDIRRLNNLGPTPVIYTGDKLLIMQVGTATPGTPSPTATAAPNTVTPSPTRLLTSIPSGTTTPTPLPTHALPASSGRSNTITLVAVVLAALVVSGVLTLVSRHKTID